MAISEDNGGRDIFRKALEVLDLPLLKINMAQLGNQKLKTNPGSNMKRLQSMRSVWEWFGGRSVSFDLNGQHGALPYDLRGPLPDRFHGLFNLVTNFGTSEHVSKNQWQVFKTIHDLCEVGGVMLHQVPHIGLVRHGVWQYDVPWFILLHEACRYEVYLLKKRWRRRLENKVDECHVQAIFRKTDRSTFPPAEGFTKPYYWNDWRVKQTGKV